MEKGHGISGSRGSVFGAIVVILFILTLLVLSGALYWEKEKVTQQYLVEKEQMQQERSALKDQIVKEQKDKERNGQALLELEKRYDEIQERYLKLEQDYSNITALKKFIETKFDEFTLKTNKGFEQIEHLSAQFDNNFARLSSSEATSSKQTSKKRKNDTAQNNTDKSIELPPVVVQENKPIAAAAQEIANSFQKTQSNDDQGAILQKATAQIMSINREHNFVVINKGLVDGIKTDDVFDAYRDGQKIAIIRVSEIRDFVSLGLIKELKKGFIVQEGDALTKEF